MTYQLPRDSEGRVLGLRLDLEDAAALQTYQAPPVSLPEVDVAKLPESQGVAKWMQIEAQLQIGSCAGHSRTYCLEKAYWAETKGKVIQFNRMFAYLSGQKLDGLTGDVGATISGQAKATIRYGIALEESWPYTGKYPAGGYLAIPAAVWTEAKAITLGSYRVLRGYHEVLQWLAHGIGGVSVGIEWNRYCEPNRYGQIDDYRDEKGDGGHAVSLLDWNKKYTNRDGLPYLDLFNSWGEGWGHRGRAFVAPRVVDHWCKKGQVVGYANVQGDAIKPREMRWTEAHVI